MRARTVLSVTALAGAAVLAAAPASASPAGGPACGDTLTVDTVLTADLTCTGPGLRLGPGVTLDLRGHTLRGPGTGVGVEVASTGAAVVRGGTIAGWEAGVRTYGVEETDTGPLTVDRVRLRDNRTGVDASGESPSGRFAKPTTVRGSTFTGNGTGAEAAWSGRLVVERSTFADNRDALWVDAGSGTVTDTRFVRNERAVLVAEGVAEVRRTTFLGNGTGVAGFGAIANAVVADSRFVGSQVAVDAGTAAITVTGTSFTLNRTAVTLGVYGGAVEDSTFHANGTGITVEEDQVPGPSRVVGNVLRLNRDGIVLDPADAGVAVGGNDVRRSAGRGIHAPGVTDLGGNVARGNGTEPQCVGVVCG